MDIRISRKEVLNNLIRFKQVIEQKQESKKRGKYHAMLNCRTGDLQFAEKISNLSHRLKPKKEGTSEWKKIHIDVEPRSFDHIQFQAFDDANIPLTPTGLDPLAWKIIHETIQTLNRLADYYTVQLNEKPESEVLKDLSEIHMTPSAISIEDIPGWVGSIDRYKAEKLLRSKSEGTYLLRNDVDFTNIAFQQLEETNHMWVNVYICTVKEPQDKIADILILQCGKGWTIYEDNPNLTGNIYYPSLEKLLESLKFRVKRPIEQAK